MHGPIYDISTLAFSYMACLLIHVYSRQYMLVNDSYQFMNMITIYGFIKYWHPLLSKIISHVHSYTTWLKYIYASSFTYNSLVN